MSLEGTNSIINAPKQRDQLVMKKASKFLYSNMSKAELKLVEMKKQEKMDFNIEKKLTLAENETQQT